jgi:WD40 repeat protein
VVESAYVTCATFADSENLVTGSSDYTVRLWRWTRASGVHHARESPINLVLSHIMRAHSAEISCVAVSRAWSIVVSGSKDGTAVLWDLNRGTYVRSIVHGEGSDSEVNLVAINESTVCP